MKQLFFLGGELQMKRKIKLLSEEGSGLVLSLMVLLVLSVLGASLGAITISSLKLGTISRDSNSAYYIAEAGANRAYEEFKKEILQKYKDSETEQIYFDKIETSEKSYGADSFEKQFGVQPEAKVKIFPTSPFEKREAEREFTIQSIGEIDGKKRIVEKKVLIKWVEKPTEIEDLDIPDNTVAITKEEEIKFTGHAGKDDKFNYIEKDPDFGRFSNYVTSLQSQKGKAQELNSYENLNGVYKTKNIEKATIEITKPNHAIIFVDKLEINHKGLLNVTGDGTLILVANNNLKIDAKNSYFNKSKANVRIVYTGTNRIDIDGSLHAQIIAPRAIVEIQNNGEVYGTVVSKELEINNKTVLEYHPFEFPTLNGGGSQTEIEIGDLVDPGPVLEVEFENSE